VQIGKSARMLQLGELTHALTRDRDHLFVQGKIFCARFDATVATSQTHICRILLTIVVASHSVSSRLFKNKHNNVLAVGYQNSIEKFNMKKRHC